jgi:hypothetical protein
LTRLSLESNQYEKQGDMTGLNHPIQKKGISRGLKWVIRGLPLAGVAATVFLPLSRFGQQFTVLIVLVWLQVFLIFECFLSGQ